MKFSEQPLEVRGLYACAANAWRRFADSELGQPFTQEQALKMIEMAKALEMYEAYCARELEDSPEHMKVNDAKLRLRGF